MSESPRADRELLERYLDNELDADGLRRAEELIASDPESAAEANLQARIDGSLRRRFAAPEAHAGLLDFLNHEPEPIEAEPAETAKVELAERPDSAPPSGSRSQRRGWVLKAAVGLAAAVGWVAVFGQLFGSGDEGPYERRSLASVYTACVDRGFEPDWVCEDEVVFAKTFKDRQGKPLRLAGMPAGRRMVGLSYLGGLTPQATSMLAEVDGEPVIVFVAKLSKDPGLLAGGDGGPGVNVIRTEREGLVFYEVTPFNEALVAPYFEVASAD